MAHYATTVSGSFAHVHALLHQAIVNSGASVELVDQNRVELNGVTVITSVYDKYFMRNGSRASLTLTVVGDGQKVAVSAIGAGGGKGAVFNFDWGTESNLVNVVARAIDGKSSF